MLGEVHALPLGSSVLSFLQSAFLQCAIQMSYLRMCGAMSAKADHVALASIAQNVARLSFRPTPTAQIHLRFIKSS